MLCRRAVWRCGAWTATARTAWSWEGDRHQVRRPMPPTAGQPGFCLNWCFCPALPWKPQQGVPDADKLMKLHTPYRVGTRTGPQAPPQPQRPAHLHHARARRRLGMQERASHPGPRLPVCLPGVTAAPHSQQQGPGKAQTSG